LIGEKPEAPDIRRPAEAGGQELLDRDFQRIARAGAVDEDRTCDRVDPGEIELGHVSDPARRRKLPARRVDAFEFDRGSRRNRLNGRDRKIPPEVMCAP
jgi:hypothetical protein